MFQQENEAVAAVCEVVTQAVAMAPFHTFHVRDMV